MVDRWTRSPRTLWRESFGRLVLVDAETDPLGDDEVLEPVLLEGPGVEIWSLLDRPRSTDEMVSALLAGYDADPASVREDVEALLAELMDRGLVER